MKRTVLVTACRKKFGFREFGTEQFDEVELCVTVLELKS